MPLDKVTAMRLAREASSPPIRHMCSASTPSRSCCSGCAAGTRDYSRQDHPSQAAYREAVARASPRRRTSFGPRSMAVASRRTRSGCTRSPEPTRCSPTFDRGRGRPAQLRLALAAAQVRDAMLSNPEMIGGTPTGSTPRCAAVPGRVVNKAGMEALRGLAILPVTDVGRRERRDRHGGQDRGRRRLRPRDVGGIGRGAPPGGHPGAAPGRWAATTGQSSSTRTAGVGAEAVAEFDLAPVGELIG